MAKDDEMFGWHHQFKEDEFEQTLGVSEGQGSLGCCSAWGSQSIRDDWATEQLPVEIMCLNLVSFENIVLSGYYLFSVWTKCQLNGSVLINID